MVAKGDEDQRSGSVVRVDTVVAKGGFRSKGNNRTVDSLPGWCR